MVLGALAQRLPQHEDDAAQVGLFDEGVGPNLFHQVVLGNNLLAVTDQDQKYLKRLRRKWDGLAGAQQHFLFRINSKRTELIEFFESLALARRHVRERPAKRWSGF